MPKLANTVTIALLATNIVECHTICRDTPDFCGANPGSEACVDAGTADAESDLPEVGLACPNENLACEIEGIQNIMGCEFAIACEPDSGEMCQLLDEDCGACVDRRDCLTANSIPEGFLCVRPVCTDLDVGSATGGFCQGEYAEAGSSCFFPNQLDVKAECNTVGLCCDIEGRCISAAEFVELSGE